MRRSITNITSGRPALRYGVVGGGVGEDGARVHGGGGDPVHARQHRHALGEGDEGHRVGADIARVHPAQGEEPPVGVERQRDLGEEIAALVVGEERLASGRTST